MEVVPFQQFAYIVSNGLLRLDSFESLRKLILQNTTITKIVDFDKDVFETATVKACVLILKKGTNNQNVIRVAVTSHVKDLENLKYRTIRQSMFSKNYKSIFDLSSDYSLDVLKLSIKRDCIPLGSVFDIGFGLKTGDDEKFISTVPLTNKHRPLLRGENIGRYTTKYSGEYVWYVPEKMKSHRKTARPGTKERFERPKLLMRDTGGGLMGTFDNDNYYVKDVLIILANSTDPNILKKLIGVLNSKMMRLYYETSFPTLHLQRNELASLPIKESLLQGNHCNKMPAIVDKILVAKKSTPDSNTNQLESQIDLMVYHLYGLTYEEAKVIDPELTEEDYEKYATP